VLYVALFLSWSVYNSPFRSGVFSSVSLISGEFQSLSSNFNGIGFFSSHPSSSMGLGLGISPFIFSCLYFVNSPCNVVNTDKLDILLLGICSLRLECENVEIILFYVDLNTKNLIAYLWFPLYYQRVC
jgi:hypothetical protein